MQPVLDLLGETVEVGDKVAVALTDGQRGVMRIGQVIKILAPTRAGQGAIVEWEKSSPGHWCPSEPTRIDLSLQRFVVLDKPAK